MAPLRQKRSWRLQLFLMAIAALLGIGSRSDWVPMPEFFARYAGDVCWAWFAFLFVGLFFPGWSTRRVALIAYLISLAVELSQLYHAPWIDSVRGYRVGALLLGHGFLWSDLACYAVGILIGAAIEVLMLELRLHRRSIDGEID